MQFLEENRPLNSSFDESQESSQSIESAADSLFKEATVTICTSAEAGHLVAEFDASSAADEHVLMERSVEAEVSAVVGYSASSEQPQSIAQSALLDSVL